MGLKQDLETINTKTKEILNECNEHLTYPAANMQELPMLIDVAVNGARYEGEQSGYKIGYDVGYGNGKQAEYDTFWDSFQDGGTRTAYAYAFYQVYWNDTNFKPKYDMCPTNASDMFANSSITDLKGILERQGVELDLSKSTSVLRLCHGMALNTRFGVLDISSATDIRNIFYNCPDLVSVDKVVFSETTGSTYSTTPFTGATNLEEIRCEGVLWFDVSFQWCSRLTRDSLLSIISVLKDYSGDTSGTTHTLSIGSYNRAKLTDDEIFVAENKGWTVN